MKTIFIVEDNPVISKLYRDKFLREGFQVELAEDGLAAMKMLAKLRPDLVVLDLMLPHFSGVDVLKQIRATPDLKATPVVILSEAYMSDLAQAAAKIGVEQTLLKSSCTPNLLLEVVHNLLAGVQSKLDPSQQIAVRKPSEEPPPA
ncbi:MAG TPA: response regulator [Verrucomicrobiae bacterium]|nr:response regulator [Verrucomicrobiae bacterium]